MSTEQVEAAAAVLGDRARRDVPLGPLTTYRVGGPAQLYLNLDKLDDLDLAARAVRASGVPVLVVGRGSNLLVADRGFAGLALTLGEAFAAIDVEGRTVSAGGAVSLPVLARRTAAVGLTGLEWAVGVPGSVGGAVRMNAGGHGSDVRSCLERAHVANLDRDHWGPVPVAARDLDLGYRRSGLGPCSVVVGAEFGLRPGDRAASEEEIAAIVRWRREHQPGGANAGSVFANPPGDAAGRLVEGCGLRGHRRGSAFVSPKHANFIQVDDGGSAGDVQALIEEVRDMVRERSGVTLDLELRLIGFESSPSTTG
jgi:UDP-N-acetylmuramate dehydrogenase